MTRKNIKWVTAFLLTTSLAVAMFPLPSLAAGENNMPVAAEAAQESEVPSLIEGELEGTSTDVVVENAGTAPEMMRERVSAEGSDNSEGGISEAPLALYSTDKYIVTRDSDGSEMGSYTLFSQATQSVSGMAKGAYTITLTEDDLDMGLWGGVQEGYQVTLKSGSGGPYKIICNQESDTINSTKHFSQIAGDLILEDIILDGAGKGGGIWLIAGTPSGTPSLTMKAGAVIQNCKDVLNYGAAVRTIGSNMTFTMEEGSSILNCSNQITGGGVAITAGNTFIMNGGVIAGNHSEANGGGVSIGGKFVMNGGEIRENSAQLYGGGVLITSGATIEIAKGTIQGNEAQAGGGIYLDDRASSTVFNIAGATITENEARNGGGVYSYALLKLSDCTITKNIATSTGGGLLLWTPVEIQKTEISGNEGKDGGGLFLRHYFRSGTSTLQEVQLKDNKAEWGGGIEVYASELLVEKSEISANEATENGGGIASVNTGSVTLEGTQVIANKAAAEGGGIYSDDSDYANPAGAESYQKIKTDSSTLFAQNFAGAGLFNPPSNAAGFTNLGFSSTSLTGKNMIHPDSLLNNYDINYANAAQGPVQIFNVTYMANGGVGGPFSDAVSASVAYMVKGNAETGITRDGYVFTGWNTNADGSGTSYSAGTSFLLANNITLYAQWEKVQVLLTVTFETNGGSKIEPMQVEKGGVVSKPVAPTKAGYQFAGWYKGANLEEKWDFATDKVTENITLYARWEAVATYTVTYYDGGADTGSVPVDTAAYLPGTKITVLGNTGSLVKTGFTFSGWLSNEDTPAFYPAGSTLTMPGKNITLTAQWASQPVAVTYTLTYDVNGGVGANYIDPARYVAGTVVSPLKALAEVGGWSRSGYTFIGWGSSPTATAALSSYTFGGNNAILYAIWAANPTPVAPATPTASSSTRPVSKRPVSPAVSSASSSSQSQAPSSAVASKPAPSSSSSLAPVTQSNNEVPLATHTQAHWSLFNLILTAVSMLGAVLFLWRVLAGKKQQRDDNAYKKENLNSPWRYILGILPILAGPVLLVLFIFTQNLKTSMVLFDTYSIMFAVIAVLQLAFALLFWRRDKTPTGKAN